MLQDMQSNLDGMSLEVSRKDANISMLSNEKARVTCELQAVEGWLHIIHDSNIYFLFLPWTRNMKIIFWFFGFLIFWLIFSLVKKKILMKIIQDHNFFSSLFKIIAI